MYNGSITANAVTPSVNMKNRIINGAMVIDQRNAGASVNSASGGGVYPVDRFEQESAVGGGVMAMQQSTIAPTGFYNSLSLTVSTADSSLAAGDRYNLRQIIEGYNVADLNFGTANAKTVTLSFWVRSSVTGTYCAGLRNGANARSYVSNYTISSANTWEYKTITIAGDTTGTWGATNGRGITVSFALASGSTAQTTADTWSAGEFIATSSQVNWMATIGNTFYITGVQLEVGSTATSFDYRPYGTELALCQRYFYRWDITNLHAQSGWCVSSGDASTRWVMPVTMRTAPTATVTGTFGDNSQDWSVYNNSAWRTITGLGVGTTNTNSIRMDATFSSGIAGSDAVGFYCLNTDLGGGMFVNAEL
jgi:hypothetical protein